MSDGPARNSDATNDRAGGGAPVAAMDGGGDAEPASCDGMDPRACDDGNPCTNDFCAPSGCTHSMSVCVPQNSCRPSTCIPLSPTTFSCESHVLADGTSCQPPVPNCSDNNICQAGSCGPAVPPCGVPSPDDCHDASICQEGICVFPLSGQRTCNSLGNKCEPGFCFSGFCHVISPRMCLPSDVCHVAGECDPETGICSNPPAPDGTTCTDHLSCNGEEVCQAGVCVPGNPLLNGTPCGGTDPCSGIQTCEGGACVTTPAQLPGSSCQPPDSACPGICDSNLTCRICDDGNLCTNDRCDTTTSMCAHTNVPNGTDCEDENLCNGRETCKAGVCAPGNPRPNGTSCDDGDSCNGIERCKNAVCMPGRALPDETVCVEGDHCLNPSHCHGGACDFLRLPKPDGTLCSPGNACMGPGTCSSGSCGFSTPSPLALCRTPDGSRGGCYGSKCLNCDDGNPCTFDMADSNSVCVHQNVGDDTLCDDGNTCDGGTCHAGKCRPGRRLPDGVTCYPPSLCTGNVCGPDPCLGPGVFRGGDCSYRTPHPDGADCSNGQPSTAPVACKGGVCTISRVLVNSGTFDHTAGSEATCDDSLPLLVACHL